ncbi:TetR/AcrR family transcriptional regulator [Nocardia sp. NPDC004415]
MEGLTIGGLAERLDMSKAGVVGPFGSRAELQAAALERAGDVFRAAVLDTVRERAPGPARLAALLDAWIGYLAECPFPGGCFVTAASSELDGRPGPLRDRLGAVVRHWRAYLSEEIAAAGTADRPADELATVLIGISMAVNQEIQLLDDPTAARRGRIAMRAAVGLPAE